MGTLLILAACIAAVIAGATSLRIAFRAATATYLATVLGLTSVLQVMAIPYWLARLQNWL